MGLNAMRRCAMRSAPPDCSDERRGERSGCEQSSPNLHRLPIIGARKQPRPQAAVLALGHFGRPQRR